MRRKIKTWWNGTFIPEPTGSPLLYGDYSRHWTSKLAHFIVDFYLRNWQWVWGTALVVLGFIFK
jgi:hypothetical protein